MKKKIILVIVLVIVIGFVLIQSTPRPLTQKGYEIEVLVENLDTPWAIDFLPNGNMIFTERSGKVSVFNGTVKVIGNIDVNQKSESGLHGIAVDPDFNENKFIYLYYTYDSGNRVSRFILDETLTGEKILLNNIPNARFHDGGRIKFKDNMLYITTGDATNPSSAQDINSLAGKILRINKDGSIPEDNPFGNYVYSYGHRNPQGITFVEDKIYSVEHGPTKNDELNLILKGENYDWPTECDEGSETIRCFSEFTLAPSAVEFYKGDLYIGGLRGTQLRKIVLENDKIVREEELFSDLGRIREVKSYDGYLYIATSNRDGRGIPRLNDDKIIRIR